MNSRPDSGSSWPLGLKIILPLALMFALVGVVLGVQNAVTQNNNQHSVAVRSVQSDLASCVRGDVLRHQIKDGFAAINDAVTGILATIPSVTPGEIAFQARIAPSVAKLHQAQEKIPIVDCLAVTPGAGTLTQQERDQAMSTTTTTAG